MPNIQQEHDEDDHEHEHDSEDEDEYEDEAMTDAWRPIAEDTSEPHQDEIEYAALKGEHSAEEIEYWAGMTFEELDDPQLVPGESGRIDWLIEGFNGTQESPNTETVMRSPIVNIGGYDWQIKLYPRGYKCNYLSVYIENVTMKQSDWQREEEIEKPPFPVLPGASRPMKRRSVAVQIGVLMFNPDERRTNHFQRDAHQYHKSPSATSSIRGSTDYGWPRFTDERLHSFHLRKHGERKAILRNDKLAFSAYIRIVQDPTGSRWDHVDKSFQTTLSKTGLSLLAGRGNRLTASLAASIPLMHYRAFRDILSDVARKWHEARDLHCKMCALTWDVSDKPDVVAVLEEYYPLLAQMLHRNPPSEGLGPLLLDGDQDVVVFTRRLCLKFLSTSQHWDGVVDLADKLLKEIGGWEPRAAAVGRNRLSTCEFPSIQQAVRAKGALNTTALLPLELERRTFLKDTTRKWQKNIARVDIEERIMVQSYHTSERTGDVHTVPYYLYAFVTHIGNDLAAEDYAVYVRPRGPDGIWYCYKAGSVEAMTHKQAVGAYCGRSVGQDVSAGDARPSAVLGPSTTNNPPSYEVAYLVYYVREDAAAYQFNSPVEEPNMVKSSQRAEAEARQAEEEEKGMYGASDHLDYGQIIVQVSEAEIYQIWGPPMHYKPILDAWMAVGPHVTRSEAFPQHQICRVKGYLRNGKRSPTARHPSGNLVVTKSNDDEIDALWLGTNFTAVEEMYDLAPGPLGNNLTPAEKAEAERKLAQHHDGLYPTWPPVTDGEAETVCCDYFGAEKYTGKLRNGKYQGIGTLVTLSGDQYTGEFVDGLYHGNGTMTYSKTNDTHTGLWDCGLRHGSGTYTCHATGDVWKAKWEADKMAGDFVHYGKVLHQEPDKDKTKCRICYVKDTDTVLVACGHTNLCGSCAARIEKCHICGARIPGMGRVRVFGARISNED